MIALTGGCKIAARRLADGQKPAFYHFTIPKHVTQEPELPNSPKERPREGQICFEFNMKFRFCGDLDCPDWVLAEISILSRISSVKMKLLSLQVVKSLCGEDIDYTKVQKFTADAKFEHSDVKASIAALSFILSSAAKYGVDGDSLSNELQQLGLPREHSISLHKVYEDNLSKLQDVLRATSFRLDKLKDLEWRVDYVLGSSQLKQLREPEINLRFVTVNAENSQEEPVSLTMTSDKFRVLLHELKQAYKTMESLS